MEILSISIFIGPLDFFLAAFVLFFTGDFSHECDEVD